MRARSAVLAFGAFGAAGALGLLAWAVALLPGCQPRPKTTPDQYRAYCVRCHGARGEGEPKTLKRNPAADLLASTMMARADRPALRRRISRGYGPMPAFSHYLSPEEIERMIDYILQLHAGQRKGP